jgi:hypothetical protein
MTHQRIEDEILEHVIERPGALQFSGAMVTCGSRFPRGQAQLHHGRRGAAGVRIRRQQPIRPPGDEIGHFHIRLVS